MKNTKIYNVMFGGNYETLEKNPTYGADIARFAEALKAENDTKLVIAYHVAHIFTDDVVRDITDNPKMTTARFMLKYFDMRKQTVSGYAAVGALVTRSEKLDKNGKVRGYNYAMTAAVLENFKYTVLRTLAQRFKGDAAAIEKFVNERCITPSFTVADVSKLIDKHLGVETADADDKADKGGDAETADDKAETAADAERAAIISAFRLISDTIGHEDDTIRALADKLTAKGFAVK